MKELHLAPLQGYTDAEYRHAHRMVYGNTSVQYSPFLRIEKGEPCPRTLRDILSPLNTGEVIPQVIAGSREEFIALTSTLQDHGFTHIDINMGCPFPPQVKRKRGAGTLGSLPLLEEIAAIISSQPQCSYSVKMRAGIDSHTQWREALNILNNIPLKHIALHPRIATDQYRGKANHETFAQFAAECRHPLIYNGDITTPAQIREIEEKFPTITGIMAGRGLLSHPSIFSEYIQNKEWSPEQRLQAIRALHQHYSEAIASRLCGNAQLLSKLIPFWDYLEDEIGRKSWKAIHKAKNMDEYLRLIP